MKSAIGDRMKCNYEDRYRSKLTRRTPVIMRLDGKSFHTLTKHCEKPFDDRLQMMMVETAKHLCSEIQGAKCAYIQSDEISILITDYDKLTTDAWFDYNIQKMCSVSASIATAKFNQLTNDWSFLNARLSYFDSRVFNVPVDEVCNYFIWRQKDWERNSIQMLAQHHFSHSQLQNKNANTMHEMLMTEHDVNWTRLEDRWKNGTHISKVDGMWRTHKGCPIFTRDRETIELLLVPDEL